MSGNETVGSAVRTRRPTVQRDVGHHFGHLLIFMVGFFVVGSYRHWLPAELVGPIGPWPPQLASFAKRRNIVLLHFGNRLYQARLA